jgi:hypothetical protein
MEYGHQVKRNIKHLSYQQQGMGLTGWLFVIAIFGFALTISMKTLPLYLNHNTMLKVMTGMAEEKGMASKSSTQINKILEQRFRVNNILEFNYKDNVTLVRDDRSVTVTLAYEERVPLIRNLDLIASFNDSVELKD